MDAVTVGSTAQPENRINGILLVDKPQGWTSFDVVNYVRKIAAAIENKKPKHMKVGHTGTLDPLATGLLVLLLGSYTKRASELSKVDKSYDVSMVLGFTSTTGDREGDRKAYSDFHPSAADLRRAMSTFTGDILQTPPIYSAVKVNGQRAYTLARQGKAVKLEPRRVSVYDLHLTSFTYPDVRFMAHVSSGTYIRSLVEDMGSQLGTGAYMSGLRRVGVGSYKLADAASLEKLDAEAITDKLLQVP